MRFALMFRPPALIGERGLADWSLDSAIQRHVAEVLRYTEGDQRWAASELGVAESTLYRWLRSWAKEKRAKPQLARRSA